MTASRATASISPTKYSPGLWARRISYASSPTECTEPGRQAEHGTEWSASSPDRYRPTRLCAYAIQFYFLFLSPKNSDLYTQLWQRGFVLRGSCKIAFYTVPLSAVDGEILLLPVRARHVENARTWFPTLWYTVYSSAANNTESSISQSILHSCQTASIDNDTQWKVYIWK